MPGDAVNSGIGFLDVQFGALEFSSDSSSIDGAANEKYNSTNSTIPGVDMTSGASTVNTANTSNSLDIETTQTSTAPFNASSQMVKFTLVTSHLTYNYLQIYMIIFDTCNLQLYENFQLSSTDNLPVSSEHSISSQNFTRGSSTGQSLDITKQDFTSQVSPGNAPTYGSTTTYQPSQKSSFQPSSGTPSTYNAYSNNQSSQSTFQNASAASTNSYSATATVSQASYNSTSFPQSNASTFNQASPSASASVTSGYNQPTTSSQVIISSSYLISNIDDLIVKVFKIICFS